MPTSVLSSSAEPFWPPFEEPPSDAPWSYEAEAADGPENWGLIKKKSNGTLAYPICAGVSQSPIDLPVSTFASVAGRPVASVVSSYTPSSDYQIVARPSGHPGFQVRSASHGMLSLAPRRA